MFEGHRWYDLIRRGRITEVMENILATVHKDSTLHFSPVIME